MTQAEADVESDIASTLSPRKLEAMTVFTSWALTSVPLVHLEVATWHFH